MKLEGVVSYMHPSESLTGTSRLKRTEIEREQQLMMTAKVYLSLTTEECQQLKHLIVTYADVFAFDSSELGSTPTCSTHSICSSEDGRYNDMLQQEIVLPSYSPWASPVNLVAKQDGLTHFCVDYQRLNTVTKMDVFPLSCIDDNLDLLCHSRYFSFLDLTSGY